MSSADLRPLRIQLVGDAGAAALLALLVATTLSVYTPRGMTPYGVRKQHEHRDETGVRPDRGSATGTPAGRKCSGSWSSFSSLLFVILHLTGRGLGWTLSIRMSAASATTHTDVKIQPCT